MLYADSLEKYSISICMYVYTRKQVRLVLQVLITSITCPFQMLLKHEDGEGVRNSMNRGTSFFSCDENLK